MSSQAKMEEQINISKQMLRIMKEGSVQHGPVDCMILKHDQSDTTSFSQEDVMRVTTAKTSKVKELIQMHEDVYQVSGIKVSNDDFVLHPQKIVGDLAVNNILPLHATIDTHPNAQAEDAGMTGSKVLVSTQDTIEDEINDRQQEEGTFADLSLEKLKSGTYRGLEYCQQLREILVENFPGSPEIDEVDKISRSFAEPRSIIGIFGATGAGKSSIVNALLGEEQLVPTNCMRASTATVTEIMYNCRPSSEYVAEIEFVDKAQWRDELQILLGDIEDAQGRFVTDSEADIAYSKVKAVYPEITKKDLPTLNVETLIDHHNVREILGTTKEICVDDSAELGRRLAIYVDSKEKIDMSQPGLISMTGTMSVMEYWPLIRVVRLHVRSPYLASGSILVDLPGVHDSNPARVRVARNYMKNCSSIWVVAPIVRAIDDKSAQTLLNDTFKRQLHIDGKFNIITIICSKTDEIKVGEASNSLRLNETFRLEEERLEQIEKERSATGNQLRSAKTNIIAYRARKSKITSQMKWYQKKKALMAAGATIHPPLFDKAKRKRTTEIISPSKRPKAEDEIGRYEIEEKEYESDVEQDLSADPLTMAFVGSQLADFKSNKSFVADSIKKSKGVVDDLKSKLQALDMEESTIKDKKWRICVAERNRYVVQAMKEQFADSIREIDQQNAEEDDPENFDPRKDYRDYDNIAKHLPVLCVSSAGYHALCGRLVDERISHSFEDVVDTQIPQLGSKCLEIGEQAQRENYEAFLEELNQLLTRLRLWTTTDEPLTTGITPIKSGFDAEDSLQMLISDISEEGKAIMAKLSHSVDQKIFTLSSKAVNKAKSQALETCFQWGVPIADGGIHWLTFRATLRRNGVWKGRNLNNDLLRPLLDLIQPGWKQVFVTGLPLMFTKAKQDCKASLEQFRQNLRAWCLQKGTSPTKLRELDNLTAGFQGAIKREFKSSEKELAKGAREANRVFIEAIEDHMQETWRTAANEKGLGMSARSKDIVAKGLEKSRGRMFSETVGRVKEVLQDLLDKVDENLEKALADQAKQMRDGFAHFVSNRKATLTRQDQARIESLRGCLRDGDAMLERLFDPEVPKVLDVVENAENIHAEEEQPQGLPASPRHMSIPIRSMSEVSGMAEIAGDEFWESDGTMDEYIDDEDEDDDSDYED